MLRVGSPTPAIARRINPYEYRCNRISLPALHHYCHHCHQESAVPPSVHTTDTHHKRLTCIPTIGRDPLPKLVTAVTTVTAPESDRSEISVYVRTVTLMTMNYRGSLKGWRYSFWR